MLLYGGAYQRGRVKSRDNSLTASLLIPTSYFLLVPMLVQTAPALALRTAVAINSIPSTPSDTVGKSQSAGIGWPLPIDWSDEVLEQRLFARSGVKPGRRSRREPDWTAMARELKRPGVNLMVLWEEYRAVHPEGYGYSRFCDLFREFEQIGRAHV